MGFTKQDFALAWSIQPQALDWQNLQASGCRVVLLMWPVVRAELARSTGLFKRLHDMGIQTVLRTLEDYYNDQAPGEIVNTVQTVSRDVIVRAVVAGVEPDSAQDFTYGAHTWGQPWAYVHRRRFDAVRVALQGAGYKVISPGWKSRSKTEDDPPQPGKIAWREICTEPEQVGGETSFGYNSADGNGFHWYNYNDVSLVDTLRFKWTLQSGQELFDQLMWIDEAQVGSGSQVQRMQACIDMANILLNPHLPYGERVAFFAPFVSTGNPGNPPSWDIGMLMRDPACYQLLGQWMRQS